MERIRFDEFDKELSRVALGAWAIGGFCWGGNDEKDSIDTIRKAIDKGINVIDTAPAYGFGKSEELIGKAVKESGKREDIVIATKCGLEWDNHGNITRNSSRERILREVEDSLERLQTDYIDLYQIHWPDNNVSFEKTAEALQKLLDEKRILQVGVSNFSHEQMKELRSFVPIFSNQPPYNIFERQIEADTLPYSKRKKITTIAYGVLCRGLLSGKVSEEREFPSGDIRSWDPKYTAENRGKYVQAAQELDNFAQERFGKRIIHLAVRYALDKGIEIPIWGARRPEQLDPLDEVWGWNLSENDLDEIDNLVDSIVKEPIGAEFMAPPK